jgi:hypothetical protein
VGRAARAVLRLKELSGLGIRRPRLDNTAEGDFAAKKLMIQFICPKCNRELAWAYEYASVYCRVCDRWIRAGQLKRTNPAKIDPEQDQLILF